MPAQPPILRSNLFRPGQRVAVAVSGGADSVALLRRLIVERARIAVELSVAHVHHGIRGEAAEQDAVFAGELAAAHELPFYLHRVDAPAAAQSRRETLEEAARNLRYAFFRELIASGKVDAVATAHTLDDQAETVLHKLIRGAWTEGLSGIHPVLVLEPGEPGVVLRPFLENRHQELVGWLQDLRQAWREDLSNQDETYTRNRIRSQLVPLLRTFNPQVEGQLARLASIAAEEEAYWQREVGRILPGLLLPGRPVRGGGRSTSTHPEQETVAIEQSRLRDLSPAVARRVVRAAARQLGSRLSFEQTEQILGLLQKTSQPERALRFDLPGQIRVERSLRELRLSRSAGKPEALVAHSFVIPGEITAPEWGLTLRGECADGMTPVTLRAWKAGDRVQLRHSQGPKKVADVLDRLHIAGDERKNWPVVVSNGAIVWMRGADVEAAGMRFSAQFFA